MKWNVWLKMKFYFLCWKTWISGRIPQMGILLRNAAEAPAPFLHSSHSSSPAQHVPIPASWAATPPSARAASFRDHPCQADSLWLSRTQLETGFDRKHSHKNTGVFLQLLKLVFIENTLIKKTPKLKCFKFSQKLGWKQTLGYLCHFHFKLKADDLFCSARQKSLGFVSLSSLPSMGKMLMFYVHTVRFGSTVVRFAEQC